MKIVEYVLGGDQSSLQLVDVDGRLFIIAADPQGILIDRAQLQQTLAEVQENLVRNYLARNLEQPVMPLKDFIDNLERALISQALLCAMGNKKNAAFLLGLKPSTLIEKIKRLKLSAPVALP